MCAESPLYFLTDLVADDRKNPADCLSDEVVGFFPFERAGDRVEPNFLHRLPASLRMQVPPKRTDQKLARLEGVGDAVCGKCFDAGLLRIDDSH